MFFPSSNQAKYLFAQGYPFKCSHVPVYNIAEVPQMGDFAPVPVLQGFTSMVALPHMMVQGPYKASPPVRVQGSLAALPSVQVQAIVLERVVARFCLHSS
eukprot:GHVN01014487.1.p1 GENE.GHVN01014487.1~~GHVN01014487.1.p1  ORF type:complete len:100 (-),score=4.16 GHVN01014487.1:834-1133(-)